MSMESTSPIDWQASQGCDDISPPPIVRRATIGEPGSDGQGLVRQRRTSIVACDRCRRRKIRCSGQQPCATCARFGVRCTKPEFFRERSNQAEHAALVDRIRMLEARLAAVGQDDQPLLLEDAPSAERPLLRLETDFADATIQQSTPRANDAMSLSIPTIQITGPHNGSMPSSPIPGSPAPSLFSGTSRSSTPDPFAAVAAGPSWLLDPVGILSSPAQVHSLSDIQWPGSLNYNTTRDSPDSPYDQALISRRSSMSSFNGRDNYSCASGTQQSPLPSDDWPFEGLYHLTEFASMSLDQQAPIPTKEQAEAWADLAFHSTRLGIEKTALKLCIQAVYEVYNSDSDVTPASHAMLSLTSFSLRTARCVVFLVLSIGMRMSGNVGASDIESCYAFAHSEFRTSDFWAESGAEHIAGLLHVMAGIM